MACAIGSVSPWAISARNGGAQPSNAAAMGARAAGGSEKSIPAIHSMGRASCTYVHVARSGEAGLTFRALSERLATSPGALYWHIADKSDLLNAACDAIVARATEAPVAATTPQATIRAIALGLFDAIDAHPWVGSTLTRVAGGATMVRIVERVAEFLEDMATTWSRLDKSDYPFARSVATQMRAHDDRADFLAGVELILRGIAAPRGR